ncbi:MAG: hypothetical protein WEB58_10460 [Planctomycetaceae bacterium]
MLLGLLLFAGCDVPSEIEQRQDQGVVQHQQYQPSNTMGEHGIIIKNVEDQVMMNSERENGFGSDVERADSDEPAPVELKLSVSRNVDAPRNPLATVVLNNVATESLSFKGMGGNEIQISVFDEYGNPCNKTSAGKKLLGREPSKLGSSYAGGLARGKSCTWEKDLRECFELAPGVYTAYAALPIRYLENGIGKPCVAKSAPCIFEIVK